MILKAKSPMKITKQQFQSFCCSGSDKLWAPFVNPNNIWSLKVKEGTVPFVCFDVEGSPHSPYLLFQVPPEVATRHFPQLKKDVLENPEAYDLRTNSDGSVHAKDMKRVDVLDWTQNDCVAEKDGEVKPTRPNPTDNGWRQTSKVVEKLLIEALKAIQPVSAARIANEKRSRDDELESAAKVFKQYGFDFKFVLGHTSEVAYQLYFKNSSTKPLQIQRNGETTVLTRFVDDGKQEQEEE